ncbi:alkaline phosphatase PhoX [Sulfuriflexus mobilis]|uniref:alkaline phosphatase PhoX n=1 Tax=Sulfuriflexus mobilis TaxID=1811807 RepID=UPI00155931A7|nr:alkaline phosphatase PhoX [Sulfuriflexus mobilis]
MNKTLLAVSVTIAVSGIIAVGMTHADSKNHSFSNFKQLEQSANNTDWDPALPWKLPKGFRQSVVADETALNIYDAGRDDWHDMNTVNETGNHAGRFMYRTHELRFPGNQPEGGTVSVVDLKTGEASIIAQDPSWDALDGIRWTPWGTVLFAEEKTGGRLFEMMLNTNDLTQATAVVDRPAVGRLAHEGIELDKDGNVYIVDEYRGRSETRPERGNTCAGAVPCGGGIYKFVPDTYGDLSSGSLYVLKVTGPDGTGQGEWLGPIDPLNARAAGTAAGGQSYQRPEDLEVIGNTLYVAITEGPRDETDKELYEGRIISIALDSLKVANFIKPGVNVPVEIGKPGDEGHQSGFDSIDNLAEMPDGNLMLIEDNKPSDIWVASTRTNDFGASKKVRLFASLTDPDAEGTGIYFSPTDSRTLYVNIQHSTSKDGDGTWAISKMPK